jgi:hypothetical protein
MSDIGGTESVSEGPSIVDPVGFGGLGLILVCGWWVRLIRLVRCG